MDLQNFKQLSNIFKQRYYESLKEEFVIMKEDLNKILEIFNKAKLNLENDKDNQKNLLVEKEKAINCLDIEKLKELEKKLSNFD